MCYSKADGGLRCPNTMRPRLDKAIAAFRAAKDAARAAKDAGSPDFPALKATAGDRLAEVRQTYAEYAAHPAGQADLERQLDGLDPAATTAADTLRQALARGAFLRERAFAIRAAGNRAPAPESCDESPRTGRSSQVMVQGRTAKQLVTHHGLTEGDRITVTHGGLRTFTSTGIFRGTQRGGDNGRGQILIEHADGRVAPVQANAVTDVQHTRETPAPSMRTGNV
jgi:hypothetical protein